jgi:hypothetical protein
MITKYKFTAAKDLRMPATDFADWSEKHYKLTDVGHGSWLIECYDLKHLAEALLVLNYGDQKMAFLDMVNDVTVEEVSA